MMIQELRVGDIFYICHTHTKKVIDGPYKLSDLRPINLLVYFVSISLENGSDFYFLGPTECIKVGSMPEAGDNHVNN